MRLGQLDVLYDENLCGWNSFIPRELVWLEQLLYHENQGIWMIGAVGQTCSVRGHRAMYSSSFFH